MWKDICFIVIEQLTTITVFKLLDRRIEEDGSNVGLKCSAEAGEATSVWNIGTRWNCMHILYLKFYFICIVMLCLWLCDLDIA